MLGGGGGGGGIVRSEGREDEKLPKVNNGQLLVHYAENDVSVDYPSRRRSGTGQRCSRNWKVLRQREESVVIVHCHTTVAQLFPSGLH
ncbi:hypothetical protein BDQ94DRAFT_164710 [Aspergillus welwitschiae]|uniref:Uncharacterized protein n=1 Tax=Aspergillus welwitschiae TaxID=1341132 RepID=A0A3F3PGW1_9EURO|nr:hypothetical protein BDQ94DRAFT_164710 [Aspergillus welwitschiae]RDH26164.1 hypothetical protein BDQ94DRAFT_164710 [Aspergillus welwitschiae]